MFISCDMHVFSEILQRFSTTFTWHLKKTWRLKMVLAITANKVFIISTQFRHKIEKKNPNYSLTIFSIEVISSIWLSKVPSTSANSQIDSNNRLDHQTQKSKSLRLFSRRHRLRINVNYKVFTVHVMNIGNIYTHIYLNLLRDSLTDIT